MLWPKGLILGHRPYTTVGGTGEMKVLEGKAERPNKNFDPVLWKHWHGWKIRVYREI